MTHHVVIIGAGYAGLSAAIKLAKKTNRQNVRITLINNHRQFIERVRLHQLAAGHRLREWPLTQVLEGTGIELMVANVGAIDSLGRTVSINAGSGAVRYDTLVYALGSGLPANTVPGTSANAHSVVNPVEAARLRDQIHNLRTGSAVAVVGGGLTGIETATELAETLPGLNVHLCSRARPGHWLAPAGQRHLRQALERLNITTYVGRVEEVAPTSVALEDGRTISAAMTVWTAGFRVPPLARKSGIRVNDHNRIVVDGHLRSVSHPEIYAVGDAAAPAVAGHESRMSCQTALPMGKYVAEAIVRQLAGHNPKPHTIRYIWQNVSLGRRDGVTQFTRTNDSPLPAVMTGRKSARFKEAVTRGAARYSTGTDARRGDSRRACTPEHELVSGLQVLEAHERDKQGPALRTAAILAAGGILHFVVPTFFDRIIPRRLPGNARAYTRASGAAALGIAGTLVLPRTRSLGGTLAALYFVAVMPAKVQLTLDWWRDDRSTILLKVAAIAQMPLQTPLIIEALKARRDAGELHRRPTRADRPPL
ncbi:FAD-dependent oxidoreductase [Brevibacterium picturae]|uniref:FAD/NAD(P)-binding domain-containing protein n=1 Tax=Brevibacterium picturae TaxID=260553 RepID=A0ABN2CIZ2_9MICO